MPALPHLAVGGDYNPEQWPPETQAEDITEPSPGQFELGWLDEMVDRLHAGGIRIDLATATASPPPWLSHRHPEMLPQRADGTILWPGARQAYCPSSPVYREHALRLVRVLAERTWLEYRYESVEALNEAWGTAFWSRRYADFAEVMPPRAAPAFPNPTQQLDFQRFSSDQLIDYFAFAREVDLVTNGHYLRAEDPEGFRELAFCSDLTRCVAAAIPGC